MPRRVRRDRSRNLPAAQKRYAAFGPPRAGLTSLEDRRPYPDEQALAFRAWKRSFEGLRWRVWFAHPHNVDLVRLDVMSRRLPDPGYEGACGEEFRHMNVGELQRRLDEIYDQLPELFEGPPPEDPPGLWEVAA